MTGWQLIGVVMIVPLAVFAACAMIDDVGLVGFLSIVAMTVLVVGGAALLDGWQPV